MKSIIVLLVLSLMLPAFRVNAADTPPPETVTIPGTLQSKLGCPGDWQPDCDKTFLTYDEAADVWVGTFDLPAGAYEYKVALNKSWGENYGGKADRNGPNVQLKLDAPALITFVYDHKSHLLLNSQDSVMPVVIGDFQSEIGCAKDDDATCLISLMTDPEFDGTFGFVTTKLPAGAYNADVSLRGETQGEPVSFDVKQPNAEVFFGYDAAKNTMTISTEGAPKGNIAKARAHWVNHNTLLWSVAGSPKYTYKLHASPDGELQLGAKGISGGTTMTLTPAAGSADLFAAFPNLKGYTALKLADADAAKAADLLKGQLAVSVFDDKGKLLDTTGVQIGGVLDDVYGAAASKAALGVTFDAGKPALAVWAPTARKVSLLLFDDATTGESTRVPMTLDAASGVWSVAGEADWKDMFYLYEVEVYVPSTGKVETNRVTDPYSISLSTNSTRSQIVDLNDAALMPDGWDALNKPALAAPEDAVIYELHVRDFSANDASVPADLRGTFAAFTQTNSNGMKHLQALADAGLTHVHLLPAFDIATINEDKSQRKSPDPATLKKLPPDSDKQQAAVAATSDSDGYNWGYDPYHFTTPEGSYSTDPNGPKRILEFREMVKALNDAGLRVVMDVVYNHTNSSGQNDKSVLDKIVPGYYHRLNFEGGVETSTCCQNTATERTMMEKLMIDSLKTWATAYKVDGFRFDLMGHHLLQNMQDVRAAMDALTMEDAGVDGKSILLYGEGWDFGEVADNARGVNASQQNLGGSGIGSFNDRLRDAVRGGTPFDDPRLQGFSTGLGTAPNGVTSAKTDQVKVMDQARWIRLGLAGNLAEYPLQIEDGRTVRGAQVQYSGEPAGYALDPQETVNYAAAHDNETLFDKIQWAMPVTATMAERVRMNNLAVSLIALGQGIPFFHAGDDLLRSKSLDRDSYNSGDWFNALDFTYDSNNWGVGLPPAGPNKERWPLMQPLLANPKLKATPADIANARDHFREMLQIRKSSPLFRLQTAEQVIDRVRFYNVDKDQVPGLIVMEINDEGQAQVIDEQYSRVVVLFNATPATQTIADASFADANFTLHPVQANGSDAVVKQATFDATAGAFTVPARTAAVFVVTR